MRPISHTSHIGSENVPQCHLYPLQHGGDTQVLLSRKSLGTHMGSFWGRGGRRGVRIENCLCRSTTAVLVIGKAAAH